MSVEHFFRKSEHFLEKYYLAAIEFVCVLAKSACNSKNCSDDKR
ncbi:Protein of unknown function [Pyronema omphalodes CBS 100304]|uniref:Uncharacterized protein n=1 Tax=Pyronema omphalodes (strain CBS 100304) TaxID=1076935 RepID=U4L7E2_PYROM|nr:Protein of unknown function [Pyronema omphalodes CBS 100304]